MNTQQTDEHTITQRLVAAYWYKADYNHDSPQRWGRVLHVVADEIESWTDEPLSPVEIAGRIKEIANAG